MSEPIPMTRFKRKHSIKTQAITNPLRLYQATVYKPHYKISERSTVSELDAIKKLGRKLGLEGVEFIVSDWHQTNPTNPPTTQQTNERK